MQSRTNTYAEFEQLNGTNGEEQVSSPTPIFPSYASVSAYRLKNVVLEIKKNL